MISKLLKYTLKSFKWIFIVLIILNIAILLSGKTYLYKAVYYNLVNIDDYKIFENRKVPASKTPQPWLISKNYNKTPLSDKLQKKLEELKSVAFVVIKNDSILHEQYWEGYSDTSHSNSFSMAKSWVSLAIGAAIQDGHITSIDQPIADFLPEFKEGKKATITIKHVLMMSSGLNWTESYWNPLASTTEGYYGTELRTYIRNLEVEEPSGKVWKYKSGDTQILSYVLKAATGKTLSDYISEKFWIPMGAENEAFWCLDHKGGDEKAYCCLNSNARDFARLGKLMLQKGRWKGKQIVPESYIEECHSPNMLDWKDGKKTTHYGLHWWILPPQNGMHPYYARGIKGQYVLVIPEKNAVICRLGKKRGPKDDGINWNDVFVVLDWAAEFL